MRADMAVKQPLNFWYNLLIKKSKYVKKKNKKWCKKPVNLYKDPRNPEKLPQACKSQYLQLHQKFYIL